MTKCYFIGCNRPVFIQMCTSISLNYKGYYSPICRHHYISVNWINLNSFPPRPLKVENSTPKGLKIVI